MKFLIVFALISTIATVYGQDMTCEQLEQIGERGFRKMFIAEEGGTIPKTEAEFETRCNEGKKLYKSLLEYKKCLKPFPRQIFETTTQSVSKLLKKNCGDAEGKKIALKVLQCTTPEAVKSGQTCAVGSLDTIEKLSKSTDKKEKLIPKLCCLAHVTTDCVRRKVGDIKCEDKSVDVNAHMEEIINSMSKDALDIACNDYKTLKQCEASVPDVVAELKKTVETDNHLIGNRALIAPLLALAEKVAN